MSQEARLLTYEQQPAMSAHSFCSLILLPEDDRLQLNSSVVIFYLHFGAGLVDNIYSQQKEEFVTLASHKENNLFNSL